MKERGIIFKAEMVRAILEDRKTQTRRIGKIQNSSWTELYVDFMLHSTKGEEAVATYRSFPTGGTARTAICACPYGTIGDRLWVRETHWRHGYWSHPNDDRRKFIPTPAQPVYYLDREGYENYSSPKDRTIRAWYKRPSIFMPCWASRITLEITGVRVERLQEISEADAQTEGVNPGHLGRGETDHGTTYPKFYYVHAYQKLWDSINGKGAWELNPWVWVLGFKRITP